MGFRTKDNVGVGSKAPDFTLLSQSDELVNLGNFLDEKPVVLFFYPKDDTPAVPRKLALSGMNTSNLAGSMPRSSG